MKKDNLWNKIFHSKELIEQKEKYLKAKSLIGLGPETLQFVEGAKDLNGLLSAHKQAWIRGYQNENLGPCSYGIFRTESIENMKPEEVYLGNIYGLWTFNIPYWDEHKDADMSGNGFGIPDETKCYDLIMRRYRRLLQSNIEEIIRESRDFVYEYENK